MWLLFAFKLFAGIGLFLFAMYLIEDALKNLAGRRFKLFLKRWTQNKLKAIFGGAIVTGILQSSSLVSLMILAFVGAGTLPMKNALAVILGANLGTTLDSWIVAVLGFRMNIEELAYPAVGVAGLALALFSKKPSVKYFFRFLMGFGLLFIGISFMKTAVEEHMKEFDISAYIHYSLFVFTIIGFIITTLIQSSSATMALALSALYSGAITLPTAAALVIGSEVGTTIKILLGAIGGNAAKKRVALGNFLFNIITTVVALIFLNQLLFLITGILHVSDSLIGLVTFQSMINLFSILLFFPLLNLFAGFLEKMFKQDEKAAAAFIVHANIQEMETSIDLFRKEVAYFINNALLFGAEAFETDIKMLKQDPEMILINEKKKFDSKTVEAKYEFLKELQGQLQTFYMKLQAAELNEEQSRELDQLISAARSCMHAVKSIKDISRNLSDLSKSSKEFKYRFYLQLKEETAQLYRQLSQLMNEPSHSAFETLQQLLNKIQSNYSTALNEFYKKAHDAPLEDLDITTILNFNRELFTSHKAMVMAAKDFLLDQQQAEQFNDIPVYMT